MLCTICKNFFQSVYGPEVYAKETYDYGTIPHQPSYTSLEQSQQQGCYVCHRLLNRLHLCCASISQIQTELPSPLTVALCQYEVQVWSKRDYLDLHFLISGEVHNTPVFQQSSKGIECLSIFELWPKNSSVWKLNGVASKTTKITSCGPLIKTWLKECCTSHQNCSPVKSPNQNWYPTRLLDLTTADDGYVKLIESKSHTLEKPYATLSHCWGGASIIKLTQERYKQFLNSILLADLPKTFVDAIAVARYLQTNYIWIDSLTIIQDSDDDWVQEAALMGEVYQNSHYNIGATASQNSFGGLFYSREPELVNPCTVVINQTEHILVWHSLWASGIDHSPLLQRGWVVQEHFLSPRMVHFSEEQLFWECHDSIACEIHPTESFQDGAIYESFKSAKSVLVGARHVPHVDSAVENGNIDGIDLWDKLVRRYSTTMLSFETDKLVAISGMAKHTQSILQDEYIAGLWKRCFIFHLAWKVDRALTARTIDSERYSRRPKTYTAPSWSWASIDGVISMNEYYSSREKELSSLIEYHVELETADPTGKVSNGYICVRGPVTEMTVSMVRGRTSGLGIEYNVSILGTSTTSKDVNISMDLDTGEPNWQRTYYFLALLFGRRTSRQEPSSYLIGILLEPKSGSDVEFCRVGYLVSGKFSSSAKACLAIKEIPSLSGLTFDNKYGYTMKIV